MGSGALSPSVYTMTFTRQKPAGWADGDTLTATQITNIDANLSNAIDGSAGGVYTPATALQVGGAGLRMDNCVGHGVTGDYDLSGATASLAYRVDRATIDPAASANVTIDVSYDIYVAASSVISPVIASIGLNIDNPAHQPASDGNRILVRKYANAADNGRMYFRQNSPTASDYIGFLPGISALASPQSNNYTWAEFVFLADAGRWEVLDCHSQFVFP